MSNQTPEPLPTRVEVFPPTDFYHASNYSGQKMRCQGCGDRFNEGDAVWWQLAKVYEDLGVSVLPTCIACVTRASLVH